MIRPPRCATFSFPLYGLIACSIKVRNARVGPLNWLLAHDSLSTRSIYAIMGFEHTSKTEAYEIGGWPDVRNVYFSKRIEDTAHIL